MSAGRGLGLGSMRRDSKGRYVFTFRDAQRKKHKWRLSTDLRVSQRMVADILKKRDLEERGLGSEEGMDRRLGDLRDAFLAELKPPLRAPSTYRRMKDELDAAIAFLGSIRVQDLKPAAVMAWRRKRMEPKPPKAPGECERRGVSVRTANMGASALKSCLAWAEGAGLIAENPLRGLRPLKNLEATWRKRRRALSEGDIGAFLKAVNEQDADRASRWAAELTIDHGTKGPGWASRPRAKPIPQAALWNTLVTVGLRSGEAIAATWGDYDGRERILALRASTTKARRGREVPVPPVLAALLSDLRAAQALVRGRPVSASDLIFPSPHDAPWSPANLRRELRAILERAQIPEADERGRTLDVHGLRVVATTRMLRQGVALPIVMDVVGHQDPRLTLKHYTDLRVSATRAALDSMAPAQASTSGERQASGDRKKARPGNRGRAAIQG